MSNVILVDRIKPRIPEVVCIKWEFWGEFWYLEPIVCRIYLRRSLTNDFFFGFSFVYVFLILHSGSWKNKKALWRSFFFGLEKIEVTRMFISFNLHPRCVLLTDIHLATSKTIFPDGLTILYNGLPNKKITRIKWNLLF